MRILQLIDSLSAGGAERMAVNISNVLTKTGHTIVLCSSRRGGALESFIEEGVGYACLHKKGTFNIKGFLKLVRIVRKHNIDIIHAHSTSIYWALLIKVFSSKVKIIWHDHDGNGDQLKDSDRVVLKLMSKFIDGIIAVNQNLQDWSIRNMRVRKIMYLRNFPYLNIRRFSRKDKYIILHLANLRPQKNHLAIINAIKLLIDRGHSKFEVWLAGYDWNDEYSKKLKETVVLLNLEAEVKFLGSVKDSTLLLEQASLGVLTSVSEGLPVSLLEYGLAALPVVVTNVGQCADVVGHGKFGTIVPASNPKELADALEWHIQNSAASMALGAKFMQHVEENYGPESFVEDYKKMLSSL